MLENTYLLVAYHAAEQEKFEGKAMRKTITKGEFKLLQEDFQIDIEIENIPYQITEKRIFSIPVAGCRHRIIIIDVKLKIW